MKTWVADEVLFADDLNDEFDNILENPGSLVFPLTASVSAGGFDITSIDELGLSDASAVPTSGRIRRNGNLLQWLIEGSHTNSVLDVLSLLATTSGTPAAGIGTGIVLKSESQDENPADVLGLQGVFSDIGTGTEDSYLSVLLRVAGAALDEKWRFSSTAGSGFAALLTHAMTADRTITFPDQTGTLLNNVFAGSFTRDMATASGTQDVTGVGFTPRLIVVFAVATAEASLKSFGISTVTADLCVYGNRQAGADFMASSTSASIFIQTSTGADNYSGQLSAFGADGFTITWTKGGSITGTMTGVFLAIG